MPLQAEPGHPGAADQGRAGSLPGYPMGQPALILLLSCQIQAEWGVEAALQWIQAGEGHPVTVTDEAEH